VALATGGGAHARVREAIKGPLRTASGMESVMKRYVLLVGQPVHRGDTLMRFGKTTGYVLARFDTLPDAKAVCRFRAPKYGMVQLVDTSGSPGETPRVVYISMGPVESQSQSSEH